MGVSGGKGSQRKVIPIPGLGTEERSPGNFAMIKTPPSRMESLASHLEHPCALIYLRRRMENTTCLTPSRYDQGQNENGRMLKLLDGVPIDG